MNQEEFRNRRIVMDGEREGFHFRSMRGRNSAIVRKTLARLTNSRGGQVVNDNR